MIHKNCLFLFLVVLFSQACLPDKGKNIPDVSDISLDLNIHRFEKALFSIDTTTVAQGLEQLKKQYPAFSDIYFNNVIGIRKQLLGDQKFVKAVTGYLTFEPVRKLYDTTMHVYNQLDWLKAELKLPLQLHQYYFPDATTPELYTFISEYTYGCFVADHNILAIGLDFFLGADYPHYNPTYFPNYIKRTMTKEHIVSRTIEALVDDIVGPGKEGRLLDRMIHNGKKLYVLDQLLPNSPDSIKLGYTTAQTHWVVQNESQMWAHFLDQELLYSNDYQKIRKLIEYSPNSPGMPSEAPGRTANWVGWQIVKSYMQRHAESSIEEMLAEKDAQAFLEKSRYKPRR